MIIHTESGSIYEVTPDRKKVRRLNNTQGDSEHAGFDGVWKDCLDVDIDERLFIAWRWNEEQCVLETTLTSPVVSIEE